MLVFKGESCSEYTVPLQYVFNLAWKSVPAAFAPEIVQLPPQEMY